MIMKLNKSQDPEWAGRAIKRKEKKTSQGRYSQEVDTGAKTEN
jgi:hypothetical protein